LSVDFFCNFLGKRLIICGKHRLGDNVMFRLRKKILDTLARKRADRDKDKE
jgi:hypothetical protein